ncbi:MAG: EFR1 family ferrodoxin [Lachnospiraceae bacterium]
MSLYSIYFSPTGGTKKVMDILSDEWKENELVEEIDLSNADCDFSEYTMTKEDVCLFGVPSFGGRVPEVILNRIAQMKNEGAMAIPVIVYGNRAYDDTMFELKEGLESNSFHVKAAIAAVAEHSIMHQFAKGRPDKKDETELREFVRKIKETLKAEKISLAEGSMQERKKLLVPGKKPYREYNGVPFKPKANRKCVKCGICVEKCPVQAIPKENPVSVDEQKCISCMRCIQICPHKARRLNKIMLFMASQGMKKVCSGRKPNELYL